MTEKSKQTKKTAVENPRFNPEQKMLDRARTLSGKPVLPEALKQFCVRAMLKSGLREEDARISAEVLVTTDTWGTFTHGTKQLRMLMKNFRMGRLNLEASPEVASQGPSWVLVDGHYAMPMVVSTTAMELAIAKARETGIAYAGVRHSSHFGAAGYYAVMAARQDMIGLSMCNVDPGVIAPGAKGKVIGTNPLAYAVPAGKEPPVFLDIATSAVAASKLYVAQALGKPIPDNWMVDDDGVPTTDPSGYPLRGALMPMAGHKGYGIAVLVEVLTAVLTGAGMLGEVKSWVLDLPDPTNEGHAFIAINIGAMMPLAQFKERMDWMIQEIRSAPRAKEAERIYLPGEMEWERREQALKKGMLLPQDVVASLAGLAEDVDMDIRDLWQDAV